jgi:hypothetical protein
MSWPPSRPFTDAYPHQVSIVSSAPSKHNSHTRGASGLSQMEVVGPQFPLSATATFRVAGEGIGEHPC